MRKITGVCLAVLLLLIGACADEKGASGASATVKAPESPAVSAAAGPDAEASPVASEPAPQESSGIIAESSNTVSDKEKEAILDELSDEIDSAFSGAEELEDLSDSDLDVSDIG